MDDVEAHVPRPRDPRTAFRVRPVVVEQRPRVVEDRRDLLDLLVEEAERGGVRQHQTGRALVHLRAQVVDVEVAAGVGGDLLELVAGHRHARGVGAVRRVGGDDRVATGALADVLEVGAHQHQSGQLALRARGRLQRAGVEPSHLLQDFLQPPHQLECALRALLLLMRVQILEAGQHREPLVDARVVLHRAAAERVEAGVDSEVARRELGEVAHELGLGEPGRRGGSARRRCSGHLRRRQVVAGQRRGAPARRRLLVDQLHQAPTSSSTSARRSMSDGCASRSRRRGGRRPCPRSRGRSRSRDARRARAPRGSPRARDAAAGPRTP